MRLVCVSLCVNQLGIIYYELMKPGKIVNTHCYRQRIIKLRRALHEKKVGLSEKTLQADFL